MTPDKMFPDHSLKSGNGIEKAGGGETKASPAKSPGQRKVDEYVSRILGGESKESIFKGLPQVFRDNIEDQLRWRREEGDEGIPPQYRGLNSKVLEEIWIIPEYVNPAITRNLKEGRARVIANLKEQEEFATQAQSQNIADQKRIQELERQLGIETPGISIASPSLETVSIATDVPATAIEKRRGLSGWEASYVLAKVAEEQGVDLTKLSREQYVDFAIQNFLAIDDSQLRMPPWQRVCQSAEEIVALNKKMRASIPKEVDDAFHNFCFEIQRRAASDDRSITDGVRVRQGTKDSNSWLYFKINDGTTEDRDDTYKAYISLKDLGTLTPERFTLFLSALSDSGYNGDAKIFQDLAFQGVNLNDQIVMHGASEQDAKLALAVAEKFFGSDLDQKSVGKDEVINGKEYSYSQVLAMRIKEAIGNRSAP